MMLALLSLAADRNALRVRKSYFIQKKSAINPTMRKFDGGCICFLEKKSDLNRGKMLILDDRQLPGIAGKSDRI